MKAPAILEDAQHERLVAMLGRRREILKSLRAMSARLEQVVERSGQIARELKALQAERRELEDRVQKARRERNRLTLEGVAGQFGVSVNYVWKIDNQPRLGEP